ncbi:hypothetical protein [Acetobacter oeni]|uniref:Uncharacterized protein n=1 Tax=Acetobacter oeni TaxID=304077 RepID=A0A511XJW7_9PROT|nr:hypothetical protein [Acetobacter oeni]MBB3883452.1 hypothetical protein [Acetobacter oeni]NHO19422.1 hypothetical protein [Acetobacter oeni]GBR04050.1 hypothetical protein AA21952_1281 [Acetobacter oeni LMG 21952]GEN63232.1 hypothetical protein AOE01nite_14560 [Acetobacter oeni]
MMTGNAISDMTEASGCASEHIDTPAGRALWRDMLEYAPKLETLIRYITQKQCTLQESHLCWYQRELFERRFFRVPSPLTARMIHSGESRLSGEQATIFRLPAAPAITLISTGTDKYFPLDAVILPGIETGLIFGSRNTNLRGIDIPVWQQSHPVIHAVALCRMAPLQQQIPYLREVTALRRYVAPAHIEGLSASRADVLSLVRELCDWPISAPGEKGLNRSGQIVFRFG